MGGITKNNSVIQLRMNKNSRGIIVIRWNL